jgi:hypothetical protein
MADQYRFAHFLATFFAVFAFNLATSVYAQEKAPTTPSTESAQGGAKPQQRPVRKDRVFVWDVQGTWISKAYLERLKASRSPHAAARATPALVIKVDKQDKSYPILITNFQSAVLNFLLEIEPGGKPDTYRMVTAADDGAVSSAEVTYIYFRGTRNVQDKFDALSIAEPHFAKRKYLPFVRLPDSLDTVVNRLTVAGKYTDAGGRAYEFTEGGDAVLPERKFVYEVSLDPRAADCELLQSHPEREAGGQNRVGFAWAGTNLRLFNVKKAGKDRFACEAKPFAVLTPQ